MWCYISDNRTVMYYIVVATILLVAELLYFRIADKCNIIDKPNERSSHSTIVLRGGGVIFCAWCLYLGRFLWIVLSLVFDCGYYCIGA